jgi:TPP-dependent pyruvate/acetoin dehydrogenase alpha subunit
MMADGADAGAAWENPLIPNARLRQIYLAMARARALAGALSGRRATVGLEACLVSPAVDLVSGDLVSDVLTGGTIDFLRGATLGQALRPRSPKKMRGTRADSGAAGQLVTPAGVADRMWAALGAAAALKANSARANEDAKKAQSPVKDGNVVVVYALPEQVPPVLWQKVLTFAHAQELPMLFVVLPPARSKGKATGVSAIALRCRVPGIPVDADDAVAIYRVAQESIGHSRISGGPALMECVPFVVAGKAAKRADPIAGLANYLMDRRVATRLWIDRETKAFTKRLATENGASK